MPVGRCVDCGDPLPPPLRRGLCPACKELGRRLSALHRADKCEADRLTRPVRVALYEAVVARGGKLFE